MISTEGIHNGEPLLKIPSSVPLPYLSTVENVQLYPSYERISPLPQ
jgi:hypothetical protein